MLYNGKSYKPTNKWINTYILILHSSWHGYKQILTTATNDILLIQKMWCRKHKITEMMNQDSVVNKKYAFLCLRRK